MADEKFNLALIKRDPDHTFELTTSGNTIVPLNIKTVLSITNPPPDKRSPNQTEAMMLLNTALAHGADPYQKEAFLIPVFSGGFHYEVCVAAQVRMRVAQAQDDYDGYRWGWITDDFVRHGSGRESQADPSKIIGVWGEVYRKDQKEPYYHETMLKDFKKTSKTGKSTWETMPTVMILKVNRDQTHKFAYADKMGNLNTVDEIKAYNEPLPPPTSDVPPRDERRKKVETIIKDAAGKVAGSTHEQYKDTVLNDENLRVPAYVEGSTEAVEETTEITPPADTEGVTDDEAGGHIERTAELKNTLQSHMNEAQEEFTQALRQEIKKETAELIFAGIVEAYTEVGDGGDFRYWAAFLLCCDEEDVNTETLTAAQLDLLNREINRMRGAK